MREALSISESVELSPEKAESLDNLKKASSSAKRVGLFAKIADTYGLDTIIGFFAPAVGDVTTASVAGIYLLLEAKNAGLSKNIMAKIAVLQAADVLVSLIPVADLLTDYLFKANKWVVKDFENQVAVRQKEAEALGCSADEIKKAIGDEKISFNNSAKTVIDKVKSTISRSK